jgi:hypothetical protein
LANSVFPASLVVFERPTSGILEKPKIKRKIQMNRDFLTILIFLSIPFERN